MEHYREYSSVRSSVGISIGNSIECSIWQSI